MTGAEFKLEELNKSLRSGEIQMVSSDERNKDIKEYWEKRIRKDIENGAIQAVFTDRGFTIEDRDHFCYAFCKQIPGGFLYVGKHLEEGGSEIPATFKDVVYVEINSDTGETLAQRIVPTLIEYLAEGRG